MSTLLARLHGLNRTGVFLGALVLVLAALLLPGVAGAVAVLALTAVLAALLALTWPHHDPRTRVLRVGVLLVLLALGVAKLV
jgi:hypothetical protein